MKIVVELERCSGSPNCANDEEINNYISGNYVQLAILNSYYDETKSGSPIQYYIDDTLLFDLNERPLIRFVIDETRIKFANDSSTSTYEANSMVKYLYSSANSTNIMGRIEFYPSPKYRR